MTCNLCHNTGWKTVTFESAGKKYSGMARCECRKATDAEQPGGFVKVMAQHMQKQILRYAQDDRLRAVLNETDRKIAALIEERKGQEQAISIEEICKSLWPREWRGLNNADVKISSQDELTRARNALSRSVKATVEKLRMLARMPIAATKRPPYGYYIPVTAEECDECYKRLFGEGVKLIMAARLFRPEADVVRELAGQLRITSSEL